jgi:tol-pal system protein YbgF
MIFRRVIPLVLLIPGIAPAVSKEMQELMRDVALLQQQLKDLQQAQDTKFATLVAMVQQTLDTATKANTSVAVLESGLSRSLQEQVRGVVTSSAGVGSKVDAMGGDVQALRASVEDITARLGRLQQQLADLNKAVQALATPAPAPPPAAGTTGTTTSAGGPPANLPPATVLYENATRDARGGKYDLALQEYQDYLKYYKDMDYAPNAQYNIGIIYFTQNNLDAALEAFDAVLEKYPDNAKTPDALLMKGKTLVKMGRPTQGAAEFRELIKRYKNSDQAAQATEQLKALGLPYTSSGSKPSAGKKRSR